MGIADSDRWTAWLTAILIAVFLILTFAQSSLKSPTSDEPPHIAAGLSYFVTHQIFRANPQHPPLLKELSGLSMMAGGIRWPHNEQADYLVNGDDPARVFGLDWPIGNDIISSNGPDRALFWARLPLILVAALLAALLYLWGRQMLGPVAALGAVFVCVLDPTILAHAYLVTTDVGLATFTVLTIFALWNYVRQRTWKRALWCGLALGGALAAKFSAVVLIPVVGLLLLAGLRWPARVGSMVGGAVTVVQLRRNDLCWCGSGKKYKHCHAAMAANSGGTNKFLLSAGAFGVICLAAFLVIETLYFFPSDLMMYVKCARMVGADHDPNYLNYMAGQLSPHFWSYFAVAYLLKEPLAGIILAGVGLRALIRSCTVPFLGKLFILLPPAALFLAVTVLADDLGVRYIIPALPFVYLLAGLGIASLVTAAAKVKWAGWAAAVLCGWLVLAAAGVYPDHLSYFNETACLLSRPSEIGLDGGTRCGTAWLDDSNVEWGQGLKQLKTWLDRNAAGRTPKLAIFTPFPAEAYGIKYEKLDHAELAKAPVPGLYVVSAHLVARFPAFPGASDWLRRIRPVAMVGRSLYVYDIR